MTPTDYVRAVQRRWKIVLACVLVAVSVGWLLTREAPAPAPRTFEATAHLINSSALSNLSAAYRSATNLQTVATLVTLGDVPARVAEGIGFDGDPTTLANSVEATADTTTGVLSITATAPSARRAEVIADAFAAELLVSLGERTKAILTSLKTQIADLDQQITGLNRRLSDAEGEERRSIAAEIDGLELQRTSLTQQYSQLGGASGDDGSGFEILEPAAATPAERETALVAPRSRGIRLLLVGSIGILLGIIVALLFERFDSRIRTREDAEEAFGRPVLSEVPVIPRRWRRSIIAGSRPHAPATNAFRLLAASLSLARRDPVASKASDNGNQAPRTILVTSPAPLEGKSTTVANLAAAFAETGKQVIVMCCDFRHPTLDSMFALRTSPGLSEALNGDGPHDLDDLLQETKVDGVRVLSTGRLPNNISVLYGSDRMRDLITSARGMADVVLIDTAPVMTASDWTRLIPEAEAVLVVGRAGKTAPRAAERTIEILSMLQAPIAGVVLNALPRSTVRGAGYRLAYGAYGKRSGRKRHPDGDGEREGVHGSVEYPPAPDESTIVRSSGDG